VLDFAPPHGLERVSTLRGLPGVKA
jgi:hypothetical protein